ncbi:MAG: peptidase [Rickettsiales bacterium]|nr:peptidase [Rickettsiales bacterium]|tara:strand:+ start:1455 stop:3035 length:1581 start_codon:yes stop_codon:yes gene_type:complete
MSVRPGKYQNLIRYGAAAVLYLLILTNLSACLTLQADQHSDDLDGHAATKMFNVALSYINDVYIEQLNLGDLVMTGLNGLRRLEPGLAVVRAEDHKNQVIVLFDGQVAGRALSGKENPAAWAVTAIKIIRSARSVSETLRKASTEDIYEAVFDTISQQLDPYTRYNTANSALKERAKREGFGGIGILVSPHADGALVDSVEKGRPAAKAGLKKGDRIISIGPQSISGLSIKRIIGHLRGPIGKEVEMLVRRNPRADPFPVIVVRERIVSQTIFPQTRDGLVHIRITSFNQRTAEEMRAAIEATRKQLGTQIRGFIIDVRGNPGGLLNQAVALADLFLESGTILRTRGRHPRSLQLFDANPEAIGDDMPIAVLLDGASASAAEIVASALQDQGRAIVIGASSYGKGTVQQVLRLPNNGELVMTWARMHTPSGYVLNKFGVLPNICTGQIVSVDASLMHLTEKNREEIRKEFSARRAAQKFNTKLAKKACPWRPRENNDIDLEIAKRVLNKKDFYNKILTHAGPAQGS